MRLPEVQISITHLQLQVACALRLMCKLIGANIGYISKVCELERLQTAEGTFEVIQDHWYRCHLIGHIQFPTSLPRLPLSLSIYAGLYYILVSILQGANFTLT